MEKLATSPSHMWNLLTGKTFTIIVTYEVVGCQEVCLIINGIKDLFRHPIKPDTM